MWEWLTSSWTVQKVHLQAANQVLYYLKGSLRKDIPFKWNSRLVLEAHKNANYDGSVIHRRSTTGYCTFLGGNLVTWRSKEHSLVVRSSAEENVLQWPKEFVNYYGWILFWKIWRLNGMTQWHYSDNKSAITMAYNLV